MMDVEVLGALYEALDRFVSRSRRVQKTKATQGIEESFERALSAIFRKQGRDVVASLSAIRNRFEEAPTPREWDSRLERAFRLTRARMIREMDGAHRKAMRAAMRLMIADLGLDLSFDLKNPRAVRWLEQNAARRVANIEESTRRFLARLLRQAAEEGWSYDRTAEAIIARYSEFAVGSPLAHIESRAHLIAVTEVGQAYIEGNLVIARDLHAAGIPLMKRWLTAEDARVDEDICAPNEAAGWIAFEEDFPTGADSPLGHPGCRCDIQIDVDTEGITR